MSKIGLDMGYDLSINTEQAHVICRALELYSRIKMGQIEEVRYASVNFGERACDTQQVSKLCKELKSALHPELPPNAYYGIHQEETPEDARIAWDIQQVMRHRLSWDENPNGGHTVNFHTPMKSSRNEGLPTFVRE